MSSGGGAPFRNPHNLPVKDCVVCGRPFTWRKKWERCWDEVLTCSNRCKSERKQAKGAGAAAGAAAAGAAAAGGGRRRAGRAESGGESEGEGAGARGAPAGGAGGRAAAAEQTAAGVEEGDGEEELAALASRIREAGLEDESGEEDDGEVPVMSEREARRARRQALKAERRARRAMSPEEKARDKRKPCDICGKPVNLLVRCTCDASQKWRMLCGRCWTDASGGVPDGDADHPHYRYGGLWKNRAAKVSTPSFGKSQLKDVVASEPAEEAAADQRLGA